jgi:hypothetical protein
MRFEGKFVDEKGEKITRWGEFLNKADFDEYFKKKGWRVADCREIKEEGPSFMREDLKKDLKAASSGFDATELFLKIAWKIVDFISPESKEEGKRPENEKPIIRTDKVKGMPDEEIRNFSGKLFKKRVVLDQVAYIWDGGQWYAEKSCILPVENIKCKLTERLNMGLADNVKEDSTCESSAAHQRKENDALDLSKAMTPCDKKNVLRQKRKMDIDREPLWGDSHRVISFHDAPSRIDDSTTACDICENEITKNDEHHALYIKRLQCLMCGDCQKEAGINEKTRDFLDSEEDEDFIPDEIIEAWFMHNLELRESGEVTGENGCCLFCGEFVACADSDSRNVGGHILSHGDCFEHHYGEYGG